MAIGRRSRSAPLGSTRTAVAATASWPSRNTVARMGTASPTTALAGQRPASTTGDTDRTGIRPITGPTLPRYAGGRDSRRSSSRAACPASETPCSGLQEVDWRGPNPHLGGLGLARESYPPIQRPHRPARGHSSPLGILASNLRWSWHPPTRDLFAGLDPKRWKAVRHDPVALLGAPRSERLAELAADPEFVARVHAAAADLAPTARAALVPAVTRPRPATPARRRAIAYFSPEFGITEVLPQYSGGLGILAGDHLKAASDLGVPIVGVGLFYKTGYFKQSLSPRRLAAGDLPGARPGRPAADPAARGRRHALRGRVGAARRAPARGHVWQGPGRPGAAAAAGLRRRGQRRGGPRRSPTGCTAAAASTGSSRRCCSASAASGPCGCGRG